MVACACKLSILRSEAVKLLAPGSRPAWAKTQFQKHKVCFKEYQEKKLQVIFKELVSTKKKKNKNLQGKWKDNPIENQTGDWKCNRWPMNT